MSANIEAARALYARTLTEQFALGAFNMDTERPPAESWRVQKLSADLTAD
jgi:hypothetical protein